MGSIDEMWIRCDDPFSTGRATRTWNNRINAECKWWCLLGIITAYVARPAGLLDSATFALARAVTYEITNLYAVKMAAVFMISTSTLAIRTGFIAHWIALLGYAFALFLLLCGRYIEWI